MTNPSPKKQTTKTERLAQLLKTGKIIWGNLFLVEYLKRQSNTRTA